MNKKGFTLVEILAVIAILGLLAAIISPKIINLINDSEETLSEQQKTQIINAAKKYVIENSDLLPENNNTTTIELNELLENGIIDKDEIIDPKTKEPIEGYVLIQYNKEYNQYVYKFYEQNLYSGTEYTFDYTGKEKIFIPDYTGYYKLEVWGAQGGNQYGGYGGYSTGVIYLKKGTKIYINVGGQGNNFSGATAGSGGYNGGGSGGSGYSSYSGGSGGGGATHIAGESGLLSTLNSNSLIYIVAGGGGGVTGWVPQQHLGGSGGGISGGNGSGSSACTTTGGNQLSGYQFGQGQPGRSAIKYSDCSAEGNGGSGGGYYGGTTCTSTDSFSNSSGSGGSGYIGNSLLSDKVMYCYNCTSSDNANTLTYSTNESSLNPEANKAKQGNGYAKITFIGKIYE